MATKTKTLPALSAAEAHALVERHAQAIPELPACERIESVRVGQMIAQGDVYLLAMPEGTKPEAGAKVQASRQLAPGNHPGARHVLDPDATVTVWDRGCGIDAVRKVCPEIEAHALLGPLFVAESRVTLMHPEHGHKDIPAGCYQTFFQVDAVTMQRVQD
jgi:hypothetical protein